MISIITEMQTIAQFDAWSGGRDTLNDVIAAGKISELDAMIDEMFGLNDEYMTDTQMNDFLWFGRDCIYEQLGMEY
jgi:hypothetical protein